MTPAQTAFWLRAQRRAMEYSPEIRAVILRAFAIVRDSISEYRLAQLIASGNVEQVIRLAFSEPVLDRAFQDVRYRIREGVQKNVITFASDLPKGGKVNGHLAISFDFLNPRVVEAVEKLETKVVTQMQTEMRATVRAEILSGIERGVNPRETARNLRSVIGLPPSRQAYLDTLRRELLSGNITDARRRKLLDRRFNLEKLASMPPAARAARIEKIVTTYKKSWIASNAETVSRTASLDAMKEGQRLSWEDAIKKGIVDRDRLMKKWLGVMDDRERPEHVAMEGQTVHFDERFSNNEMVPGDSTYNCRCVPHYFQRSVV